MNGVSVVVVAGGNPCGTIVSLADMVAQPWGSRTPVRGAQDHHQPTSQGGQQVADTVEEKAGTDGGAEINAPGWHGRGEEMGSSHDGNGGEQ